MVLQQFLGFVAHQVSNALRRRPGGVVIVYPAGIAFDRAALGHARGVAHDVIEHMDPRGAGEFFDQPRAFRIIDARDLGVVIEVLGGGRAVQQHEALTVEREAAVDGARVEDLDLVRLLARVADGHARRRLVIVGIGLFRHRGGEVERGEDALQIRYHQTVHDALRLVEWVAGCESTASRHQMRWVCDPSVTA